MVTKQLQAQDPSLYREVSKLNDLLHHKSGFVERFYELVDRSIKPPFAISIDGPWGSGKTTVMHLLQDKFRDRNYPVFWFNPWKYSQNSDVVLAFLQALSEHDKYRKSFDTIKESSGKIFTTLAYIGLNTALKVATQGAVSLGEVKEQLGKNDLPFESYHDMVKQIEQGFSDLVKTISDDQKNKDEQDAKPLIIFLDDFDRCLPGDAIKLLEALKNLFVTPNCRVVFICGIDTRVAKNFIAKHYGVSDEFAINYFRKIFNLTVSMPYHQKPSIMNLLSDYIRKIYDDWDATQAEALAGQVTFWGAGAEMVSVRKYLSVIHNFYAFLSFNDSYRFEPEQDDLVVHLLVIKEAWQPLYEELVKEAVKHQTASLEELVHTLIEDDKTRKTPLLLPEQQSFLQKVTLDPAGSFHKARLGNDYLLRYPTLA